MNKENKREARKGNTTTIKQLKKRLKVINNITKIIALLVMCAAVVTIVIAGIIIRYNDVPTLGVIGLSIMFVLIILVSIISLIASDRIYAKQRELKLAEIKKRAEESSLLKYPVYYKEDTITKVIEHDIENIIFQNVENGATTFDIHFKTKFQTATVQIPIREIILNQLDKKVANGILKDTIINITIDTTEEGKTQVTFLGKDFCVKQTDVTDDDLIEMFGKEIKEE